MKHEIWHWTYDVAAGTTAGHDGDTLTSARPASSSELVDRRARRHRTRARLVGHRAARRRAAARCTCPAPTCSPPSSGSARPTRYVSHTLHVEPDGSFSIIGLVWRPGQFTRIHDHIDLVRVRRHPGRRARGAVRRRPQPRRRERQPGRRRQRLRAARRHPPGPQHRRRRPRSRIHIYGTDVTRIGSSVRRYYDPASRREAGHDAPADGQRPHRRRGPRGCQGVLRRAGDGAGGRDARSRGRWSTPSSGSRASVPTSR